jgi:hypothetical protein
MTIDEIMREVYKVDDPIVVPFYYYINEEDGTGAVDIESMREEFERLVQIRIDQHFSSQK